MTFGSSAPGPAATRIVSAIATAMMLATGNPNDVDAQAGGTTPDSARSVSRKTTCPSCRIVLQRIVTLGASTDSVLLGPNTRVVRDRSGRYIAWSTERGILAVFDSTGRLYRTMGRRGSGPGEFESNAGQIVARIDGGVAVFQPGRVHLFDDALAFERAIPIPTSTVPPTAAFLDASTLFVAAPWRGERSRDQSGAESSRLFRMHVLSLKDGALRSLDPASSANEAQRRCSSCNTRHLSAADAKGDVWTAHHVAYVLERWSRNGQRRESLAVSASDWFPSDIGRKLEASTIAQNASTPVIHGIWRGAGGELFVLGGAAASGRIVEEGAPPRGVVSARDGNDDGRRVTVIDAIDPRTRTLIASARLPSPPFYRTEGDGLLYSRDEDADGVVRVTVWRAAVSRSRSP